MWGRRFLCAAGRKVRGHGPKLRLEGRDFLGEQGDFLLLAHDLGIQGLQGIILKGKTGFEFIQAIFHGASWRLLSSQIGAVRRLKRLAGLKPAGFSFLQGFLHASLLLQ